MLEWQPHVVFNLLEEFQGQVVFDHHLVSYLELLGVPYTGCRPRGLVLARDKSLAKKIAAYHRVPSPGFAVFPRGRRARRPSRVPWPLIVKSLTEHASLGISQTSLVHDDEELAHRLVDVARRQPGKLKANRRGSLFGLLENWLVSLRRQSLCVDGRREAPLACGVPHAAPVFRRGR